MQTVDELIDGIRSLPPAPRVLLRLLEILSKPDSDFSEVVGLLRFEPSLTVHLLRLCNSAFLSPGNRVDTVQEAVFRLGSQQVTQLVVCLCSQGMLAGAQEGYGIDRGELWDHSVVTALACSAAVEHTGQSSDLVFTAGLLHDIGKIALSQALAGRYAEMVAAVASENLTIVEVENRLLGMDHAEVGGRLLERWGFTGPVVDAVRHHHDPKRSGSASELASQVYVGNVLAHFMGHGYGHHAMAMHGHQEALQLAALAPGDIPLLMMGTMDKLRVNESLLNIKA